MTEESNTCRLSFIDRMSNTIFQEHCGEKDDILTRTEKEMLCWFSHAEGMDVSGLTAQVYKGNVKGNAGQGQPWHVYLNQIEYILKNRKIKNILKDGCEYSK